MFLLKYKRQTVRYHEEETLIMARVLISMPDEFLNRIDEVAGTESRTRSELIREALRSYIHKSRVKESAIANKNAAILEALLD